MKKLISFVLWWAFALTLLGFSFSDSVLDYLNNVWDNFLFGYKWDKITVDNISSLSITVKSSVLMDELGDKIIDYTLLYWPKTLDQLIAEPTLMSYMREKSFANSGLATQTSFTMDLTTADTLNPDEIYYLVSIPRDSAGTIWEVSNELCFRLRDRLYWEWDDCVGGSHAAWADMKLANISHTFNGNVVTLKWIAVNGSDNVDLFLRDDNEEHFNKLATVKMSAESYSFTLTRNGEHIVRFMPNNWWKEVHYTFSFLGTEKPTPATPEKPTVKPVVVWPKENIIAVLIWTVLLYLVYKLVRRKA